MYMSNKSKGRNLTKTMIFFLIALAMTGCFSGDNKKDSSAPSNVSRLVAQEQQSTEAHYPGKDNENHPKVTVTSPIDERYLEAQIRALIAPEMAGRLPGTKGNQLAAAHIALEMEKIGLQVAKFGSDTKQNGYLVPFSMTLPIQKSASDMTLVDEKGVPIKTFNFGSDYMYEISSPSVKIKGQIVGEMFLVEDYNSLKELPEKAIALVENEDVSEALLYGLSTSVDHLGAIVVVSERQNSGEFLKPVYLYGNLRNTEAQGPLAYYVNRDTMNQLLEAQENGNRQLRVSTDVSIENISADNVVGFLPGQTDEGFIITGHFDHLGDSFNGDVYNGALDNASGTASVLALAKSLKAQENRHYSYYFIALNGEEEGLLGAYSLAQKTLWDPERFSVINFDMIGSTEKLPILVDSTRKISNLLQSDLLDHLGSEGFIAESSDMGFSDHAAFEERGFAGALLIEFDERYYHTTNDTFENSLNVPHLAEILNAMLTWLL